MAQRKLTPKLKTFLYDNRYKVRLSDYAGEALAYLKKLRAASKAAKTRKAKTAKIGALSIPRNSELYEIIEASAKIKKQSVSTFIKKNKQAIDELIKDGRVPIVRETSYAIADISKLPKSSKVFINDQEVSKGDAIFALQQITSSAMQHTDTVVVNYEMSYDLTGNLHLELPTDEELEEAEEADDEGEAFGEMLDDFETIIPIRSKGK
jgi:hypothetical protein